MKILISLLCTMVLLCSALFAVQYATTDDGKKVILNADGTWEYITDKTKDKGDITEFKTPKTSKTLIKGKKEMYGVWYNKDKWSIVKDDNADADLSFKHIDGDAYAMVIAERIPLPIEKLKEIALENARAVAPDAEIIEEKEIIVNGQNIVHMKMQGTIEGINFVYYGYYYASKIGSIQFLAYTSSNLLEDYEQDFQDLLNGFVIYQKQK